MSYLLAGALAGLIATLLSIPTIILEIMEQGKIKNLPLLVDIKILWGKACSRYLIFYISLLFHILLGFIFGFLYLFFEIQFASFLGGFFSFYSLLFFILLFWFFVGSCIFPLLGAGFFGQKEGRHVWLELLISFGLIGGFLWLIMHYYEPAFFLF